MMTPDDILNILKPPKIDPKRVYALQEILRATLGKPTEVRNGTVIYNFSCGGDGGAEG